MAGKTSVYLEIGARKTFAGALDWPAWSRWGKTPEAALETLVAYGPRYRVAVASARLGFVGPESVDDLRVDERLTGNATTDFGAPGIPPAADAEPMTEAELARQLRILRAVWRTFDAAAEAARGKTLSVGPRGGGRSLARIVAHVIEADGGYLHALGARPPRRTAAGAAALRPMRERVEEVLTAIVAGKPVDDPASPKRPWTPRFFIRRSAWHWLDHAWELEDRTPS